MAPNDRSENIHQGRNVRRFRELLGWKQEALAYELGTDWSQKKISLLEQKETIEPGVLEQIARVLKVTPEVIKNFDEDTAVNYYNTFNDNSQNQGGFGANANNYCTFNPLDKWMEAIEEIKALNEENRKLYERLLQTEREKITILEQQLKNK